ncbi:DUF2399 domain-containing protein [Streptomyces sp. NPDC017202]|uniref:DUF2399 domain-containing protein n=1 Tax=Streptomyces sp. NPDC017202 TaxID=3364981 RepID=UPI0037963022
MPSVSPACPATPASPGPWTAFGNGCYADGRWGGVRIATALARNVPWRPWRYGAADYRAAVAAADRAPDLTGPSAATPWDPALAAALVEHGVRVEEEAVMDDLLADLGPGAH